MPAFVIARFDIVDPEAAKDRYPRYVEAAAPASTAFSAAYLVRGGTAHAVDGPARGRNVVIAFRDMDAAVGWFRCDAYQAAAPHRRAVAEGEMVAVAGVADQVPSQSGGTEGGKKGYWIARYDVRDPETYALYVEAGASAFKEHGARFLARGGACEALEGSARGRNVLIEFPSVQQALACYHSGTYQAARRHRLPVSTGEIVIVEGA